METALKMMEANCLTDQTTRLVLHDKCLDEGDIASAELLASNDRVFLLPENIARPLHIGRLASIERMEEEIRDCLRQCHCLHGEGDYPAFGISVVCHDEQPIGYCSLRNHRALGLPSETNHSDGYREIRNTQVFPYACMLAPIALIELRTAIETISRIEHLQEDHEMLEMILWDYLQRYHLEVEQQEQWWEDFDPIGWEGNLLVCPNRYIKDIATEIECPIEGFNFWQWRTNRGRLYTYNKINENPSYESIEWMMECLARREE